MSEGIEMGGTGTVDAGVRNAIHHRPWRVQVHCQFNGTRIVDFLSDAGIAGESISFPNRAAAEIDLYAGFRPTFDKLALDFGVWYYWYPGGQCFNAALTVTIIPAIERARPVPPAGTPPGVGGPREASP